MGKNHRLASGSSDVGEDTAPAVLCPPQSNAELMSLLEDESALEEGGECLPAYDALVQAVDEGDPDEAAEAFCQLTASELQRLGADFGVLVPLLQLEGPGWGMPALVSIGPVPDDWLRATQTAYPGDLVAMSRALDDLGICCAVDIHDQLGLLERHPSALDPSLLGPRLDDGDVLGQALCAADDATLLVLRGSFAGLALFEVLPALREAPEAVRAAFRDCAMAQVWLADFPELFVERIAAWGPSDLWITALLEAQQEELLCLAIERHTAAWEEPLALRLTAPEASDEASFAPYTRLGELAMWVLAAYEPALVGVAAYELQWPTADLVSIGWDYGWLTPESFPIVVLGPHDTPVEQLGYATDPFIASIAQALGLYPTEAFTTLIDDIDLMASVYSTDEVLADWLHRDEDQLEALIAAGIDYAPWATGFVVHDQLPMLWRLAIADDITWEVAVDIGPGFDTLLAAAPNPVSDDLTYDGLFAVFGDGSTRSTAQCEAFFTQLGGARVLGDQERNPDLAWEEDPITDGTDTWEIRKQLIAKAPTHDAWTTMLAALKPMGRATVQTTRSLAFVHEYEWEWKQTGVSAVSSSWHPFATPELRDLGTSYAWSGIVVLHVDASGAPSTDLMETDSEGAGTGAGGGATTVTPLTYFENHAYHEFGHSVGEATFQGMASGSGRGNTDALTYGGWATESASTFSAAMFTRTTPGEVTYTPSGAAAPTTVQLDPSDVTDYCVQLLSRGTEPGASNKLAALPGTDIAGRIAMLQASDDFKNEQMVQYVAAVYAQAGIDMPDNAFQFTGFTPSGTSTYIYASRYNGDFASYDTDAYTKVKDSTGWYALSSPAEMFAEIYTTHYADDSRPAARAGVDWQVFFDELEASPGAAALAGGAQAAPTGPTNSPAGSGEKEPAVGLLP